MVGRHVDLAAGKRVQAKIENTRSHVPSQRELALQATDKSLNTKKSLFFFRGYLLKVGLEN